MLPRAPIAPTPSKVSSAAPLDTPIPLNPSSTTNTMSPLLSPMMIDSVVDAPTAASSITPISLRIEKTRGKKRCTTEDLSAPSSPVQAADGRYIAPLRSSRRIKSTPFSSPTPPIHVLPPITTSSRESSPVPVDQPGSSPVKRPRTSSISGEIHNFHIFASSSDESDDPASTMRCRQRFNQLLGPSPLQKSFSSAALPQSPVTPPTAPLEKALTSPSADVPVRTRARALLSKMEISSAVEDLGTEMNKVFMLVHGRGMGMGTAGAGRFRRGSALRPKEGGEGTSSVSAMSDCERYTDGDMAGGRSETDVMREDDGHMDYDD